MKINTKFVMFIVALLLMPNNANATGLQAKLNSVELRDDSVIFSLQSAKTHSIPSCAANLPQTKQMWTFSINDLRGRAMYSMLMTAVAKQQEIEVTSSQACLQQIELASGIRLAVSQQADMTPSQGAKVHLYKGDGVTKLGVVISATHGGREYGQDGGMPHTGLFMYVPVDNPTLVKSYSQTHYTDSYYSFLFTDPHCTSQPFTTGNFGDGIKSILFPKANISGFYKLNKNKQLSTLSNMRVYKWSEQGCLEDNAEIWNYSNYYELERGIDPLCGEQLCIIK